MWTTKNLEIKGKMSRPDPYYFIVHMFNDDIYVTILLGYQRVLNDL
jgi:hypothetical protein